MDAQESYLSFSQRNGYESVPSPLNTGDLPYELRNELDAMLRKEYAKGYNHRCSDPTIEWEGVLRDLWVQYFKDRFVAYQSYFCLDRCFAIFGHGAYFAVLDLIEWLATRIEERQPTFQKSINDIFARYQAPYILHKCGQWRWNIIQTGTDQERIAVVSTFSGLRDSRFRTTLEHLEKAGNYLSKDNSADSATHAGKAFEACLRTLVGKPDITGGAALEIFAEKYCMPNEMKEAMVSIWKYRNKKSGVGHAEKDSAEALGPTNFEAQCYYVQCCGAISYFLNLAREQEASDTSTSKHQNSELFVIQLKDNP